MKFALINGERREAMSGLTGECPIGGHPMIAICGNSRAHHWRHKGVLSCDRWWENETDWHRNWKDQFPREWQEYVFRAEDGEKHVADVRTNHGWIIEFQHSHLKPDERRSRDAFYKKLIWVVDGTRRKKDAVQFLESWNSGMAVQNSAMRRLVPNRCTLLREWSESAAHVVLDFGEKAPLWWIHYKGSGKPMYLMPVSRAHFIGFHNGKTGEDADAFDLMLTELGALVSKYEARLGQRGF